MKRQILIVVLILLIGFSVKAQKIPVPGRSVMIDSVVGDLDKDGVSELAVAYNTHPIDADTDENVPRALVIYKIKNGEWMPWKISKSALMGSKEGGMMGDPFEGIEIKNGNCHITKQKNKRDGLIFQNAHHEKRKTENEDQGGQTDD